jgi:hypothetical protein
MVRPGFFCKSPILSSIIFCDLSKNFWSVKKFPLTGLELLFEIAFSAETGDEEMNQASVETGNRNLVPQSEGVLGISRQ